GCIGIDTDGDGWTDEVEMWVGTDSLGRCEVGPVPSTSTDWPSDLVSGGIPDSTDRVNVTDLTAFLVPIRRLNINPGHPNFNPRYDLVPGPGMFAAWININDLTVIIAGASGNPSMFSGVKAFGGPTCTPHPYYGD
ncbi:MAG TPA: thrombospondin type 3 repeat-containing protein, partial [Dehalococcoidia bacterium]|nr:thrombospondin type 3 repeat-containing protein [Dehalococcoidia bacterium]